MKFAVFLLVVATHICVAQEINKFPTDDSGNIVFTNVTTVDNTDAAALHSRAKVFFAESFVSANDVIQMDDKEAGIIIGKGSVPIVIKSGKYEVPLAMKYTIKIESKNNRYRYSIYNIAYASRLGDVPAETFYNNSTEAKYQKAKPKAKDVMLQYYQITSDKKKKIELLITSKMNEKSKTLDNW